MRMVACISNLSYYYKFEELFLAFSFFFLATFGLFFCHFPKF